MLPEEFYAEFVQVSQAHTQALRELGGDSTWQYWVRASLEVVELRVVYFDANGAPGFTVQDVYDFEDNHPIVTAGDFLGFMPVCIDFPQLEERTVRNITKRWRWDTGIAFG